MITLNEITEAYFRIKQYIYKTPLVYSDILSDMCGANVYIKLENLQKSGSFKIRGVFNKVLKLSPQKNMNLITASSGNHGYGVAFVANQLKYRSTVVVPEYTPPEKIRLIKAQGAKLILAGGSWDDSFLIAQEIAVKTNGIMISPVGDKEIIAGQGTIALEILQDLENLPNYFFCSIGSGSMIAGNGTVIKSLSPQTQVIGFQTFGADSMYQSVQAGRVKTLSHITSIVEGFAIKQVDKSTLQTVMQVVDKIYRYDDNACIHAALFMLEKTNMLIELSASICLAPLLNKDISFKPTDDIVVILCGGNNDLQRIVLKSNTKNVE